MTPKFPHLFQKIGANWLPRKKVGDNGTISCIIERTKDSQIRLEVSSNAFFIDRGKNKKIPLASIATPQSPTVEDFKSFWNRIGSDCMVTIPLEFNPNGVSGNFTSDHTSGPDSASKNKFTIKNAIHKPLDQSGNLWRAKLVEHGNLPANVQEEFISSASNTCCGKKR